MASSFSQLLRLELQADGENDNTWGQKLNAALVKLENAIAGRQALVLASSDITLSTVNGGTSDQAGAMILDLSGTLSDDVNIIAPNKSKVYIVKNGCTQTADEKVSIKTASGSPLEIPIGESHVVWCDGSNGFFMVNALLSGAKVAQAENADSLGGIAASAYARLAVRQNWERPQVAAPTTKTQSGGNVAVNANVDSVCLIPQAQVTQNLTIQNPTGESQDDGGQILVFIIEQHGSTPRSVTWGSKYLFPDGQALNLTQTVNRVDIFTFMYIPTLSRWLLIGAAQNLPRS